jgi:hypothetical protein
MVTGQLHSEHHTAGNESMHTCKLFPVDYALQRHMADLSLCSDGLQCHGVCVLQRTTPALPLSCLSEGFASINSQNSPCVLECKRPVYFLVSRTQQWCDTPDQNNWLDTALSCSCLQICWPSGCGAKELLETRSFLKQQHNKCTELSMAAASAVNPSDMSVVHVSLSLHRS